MKPIDEFRIGLNVTLHLGTNENIILVPDKEIKPDQNTVWKVEWAPEGVWMLWRRGNFLPLSEIEFRVQPAASSLYRLSYPGPIKLNFHYF
jgi:hypothetical protein